MVLWKLGSRMVLLRRVWGVNVPANIGIMTFPDATASIYGKARHGRFGDCWIGSYSCTSSVIGRLESIVILEPEEDTTQLWL